MNTPVCGVFLWLVLVWAWVIWSLPSVNWNSRVHTFLISIYTLVSTLKTTAYEIKQRLINLPHLHFFNRKNDQFCSKPRESIQVMHPITVCYEWACSLLRISLYEMLQGTRFIVFVVFIINKKNINVIK